MNAAKAVLRQQYPVRLTSREANINNGIASHPQLYELRKSHMVTCIDTKKRIRAIDASSKFILCLVIGFMVNAFCISHANAASHFKVTREILLEDINPESIVRTHDGGYIVTGGQWATRIDATDKVIWRYATHNSDTHFHSAAMLPDESVILCGEIKEKRSDGLYILAFLTHINKEGAAIGKKIISPNDGKIHSPNSLDSCVQYENSVAIFGSVSSLVWGESGSSWSFLFDSKENIKSQKLSPNKPSSYIGTNLVRILPDKSFITSTGNYDGRSISHIDHDRALIATLDVLHWSFPVTPIIEDQSIPLLTSDQKGTRTLDILNDKLEMISQTKTTVKFIEPTRGYALPDHSLILFGRKPVEGNFVGGTLTAGMQWINPDLSNTEIYVFEPHFASYTVIDAIPTGIPGEFVVTRLVTPTKQLLGADEKRQGAVLTFVQIK